MPSTSNMRKSSTATMTVTESHPFLNSTMGGPSSNHGNITGPNAAGTQPRRSTSGRAIRVNTTRPANYYARPFGSVSTSAGGGIGDHLLHNNFDGSSSSGAAALTPAGFFPALQYFSDAIAALPKEVIRQFTLMKEVEAKIHGPGERLSELLDGLMEWPVPARADFASMRELGEGAASTSAAVLGLVPGSTANNSVNGSATLSPVHGVATSQRPSAQWSTLPGSSNGEEGMPTEEEQARRTQFHELRMLTHSLLANLDEKNVVLAEANRVLALQELRIDSVMPHVDREIHEDARLGSMTHWAYSDNRQKKQTSGSGAASRRDVAATNSLVAAASAIHEHDIAQARRDAGREATREKTKGKRMEPAGESDFDEKPRRGPKGAKGKAVTSAPITGLGIATNGEPATKRKKTEKAAAAAAMGMERTVSSTGRTIKAAKDALRSTPAAAEPNVKRAPKTKPAPPPPKKKPPSSAQPSPMLASSPMVASFNPATVEAPPGTRPQSGRLRQNSNAPNLRIEKMAADEGSSRPTSAAGKQSNNADRANARRRAPDNSEGHDDQHAEEATAKQLKEASEQLQRENTEVREAENEARPILSRSGSTSQKNSGRGSNVGTPRNENLVERDVSMSRTRSTRSRAGTKGEDRDSSSSEPQPAAAVIASAVTGLNKHRRMLSNSNLVKQLAPFNRSPDLDRHRLRDDMDEDLDSLDEKYIPMDPSMVLDDPEATPAMPISTPVPEADREPRRSSVRRPPARHSISSRWQPPIDRTESSPERTPPVSAPSTRNRQPVAATAAAATPSMAPARTASPVPVTLKAAEPADDEPELVHEEDEEDDDDEDGSEHDPDDPNEPKYCYCNRGSYGEMVACDNDDCPREWFHLGCTELREAPGEEEKWYCRDCRPKFTRKGRGGGRGVVGRS